MKQIAIGRLFKKYNNKTRKGKKQI